MLFLSCGKTRRGREKKTFLKQICCQSQSTGVTRCSEAGPVNACTTQSARPDCNYAGTNMLFKMSHYELMLHCQSPVCFCPTVLDSLQKVRLILGRRYDGVSRLMQLPGEMRSTRRTSENRGFPSLQIQVLSSEWLSGFCHNLFCCLVFARSRSDALSRRVKPAGFSLCR